MRPIPRGKHGEEGFTIAELIIVVSIISILLAIAIPIYGNVQANSRERGLLVATEAAYSTAATALWDNDPTTDPVANVAFYDSESSHFTFTYSLNDLGNGPEPCVVGTWTDPSVTVPEAKFGACP